MNCTKKLNFGQKRPSLEVPSNPRRPFLARKGRWSGRTAPQPSLSIFLPSFLKCHNLLITAPVMFSEGIVEADPNPAAAVQTFSIFEKIKSEVILYIFEKYYVVDRLSFRCRYQPADDIAVPLLCAFGVCTCSNGSCSFLWGPRFEPAQGNLRSLSCFNTVLFPFAFL